MARRTQVPASATSAATGRGVVDVLTGHEPLVPPMPAGPLSIDDARAVTERIRSAARDVRDRLERLFELVEQARAGEAWATLGFRSWPAYVVEALGGEPMRLETSERRDVVAFLPAQGMSTRAIAPVVGVRQPQVVKDLAVMRQVIPGESPDSQAASVASVTGLDGKTYTAAPRPVLAVVPLLDSNPQPAAYVGTDGAVSARSDLRGALCDLRLTDDEERAVAWLETCDRVKIAAMTTILRKARAAGAGDVACSA